jgi:predicted negative regulator of RcsB-dependent stress response
MKKEHPLPLEPNDLSDTLAEHPVVAWISNNGRTLLWILGAALVFFILYFRFTGGRAATESEYLQADTYFQQFSKGTNEKAQNEAYQKLASILKSHPELQAKYDGQLAQTFLNRNQLPIALDYANRTLNRTASDRLIPFADYARTSLLMADKKYGEALAKATALKQQLLTNSAEPGTQTLYLFNLIRIAMIHQQLGQKSEERKAWEEFKQAPDSKTFTVDPQIFEQVIAELSDGQASLLKYIETRLSS